MDRQKIEQVLSELEQPMIDTLQTLVRIPSVKAEPQPGAPFGKPAREALDKALEGGTLCVVGGKNVVDACGDKLDSVCSVTV